MMKRRYEIATSGADEGLQTLSSDPFNGNSPSFTGLRIPSFVNSPTTRYLALLSTRVTHTKVRVCGIRQGLEIGMNIGPALGLAVERPVSLLVTTPTFRFSDGANVSWHLVREPMARRTTQRPLSETASWAYQTSDTPAFLYSTFTSSAVDPATGAPINYPLNLTSYAPPTYPFDWQPIAGLRSINDIRFPWTSEEAWEGVGQDVEANWRVSLYASILQTNAATRPGNVFGAGIATDGSAMGGPPEEDFIYKYTFPGGEEAPTIAPIFWRIYGSILFEDDVETAS
jgi:hypothetical protein